MFDSPSTVQTSGISVLMRRMPSIVSMPSLRLSSIPVASVSVLQSNSRSDGLDAVPVDRQVADAAGDLDLPVGGARLTLLVDAHADDRGAVLARERHHAVEPLARLFALFEVGRVEDGLAADVLETRFEHLRLGGVEHQREPGLGRDPAHDLGHVVGAAAADVVDADVEHVGAFLHLLLGELQGDVPVAGDHRVLELLGAVRVHALADGEERGVLVERDRAVDRRARRLVLHVPRRRRAGADAFDHRAQVRGRGAAATADDVEPELGDETLVRVGERLGREVVVLAPVDDRRQAGVRQAREEGAAVLGEVAEVLGHLRRAGRAVQPDHVGVHRLERGERGADLGAEEQAAGGLDRDLDHHRHLAARRWPSPAGTR